MCALWRTPQRWQYAKTTPPSTHSSIRRQWLITSVLVLCFSVPFLLFRVNPVHKIHGWLAPPAPPPPPSPPPEILEPEIYRNQPKHPGFYDWQTNSSFDPIQIPNVQDKSLDQLCASFPRHLLEDIQPVLKTGHGVLDARVRPHLHGVSACLTNLLIFSDTAEHFEGRDFINSFEYIPPVLADEAPELEAYRNGSLADGTASRKAGWKVDKFKFIVSTTQAWKMRPGNKWYVFYEADTYIVWDNMFRLLAQFDPDMPWYFGSPTQGRDKTWFANGGPGMVLSREAMRQLTIKDYDQNTGEYRGPNLLRKQWNFLLHDCCGDSVLGWSLWEKNITLSGLWPHFNPWPAHHVPFEDSQWCQPVITMHKPTEEDLLGLWRWQFEHRENERPLLYRDMATLYFNMSNLTTRENWDTIGRTSFDPPIPSKFYSHDPHASFEACGQACKAHEDCKQWTYHLRKCSFTEAIRFGHAAEPGRGKNREKSHPEETNDDWAPEDLSYMSGWDSVKITKWMEERPCDKVKWVKPSVKRIF